MWFRRLPPAFGVGLRTRGAGKRGRGRMPSAERLKRLRACRRHHAGDRGRHARQPAEADVVARRYGRARRAGVSRRAARHGGSATACHGCEAGAAGPSGRCARHDQARGTAKGACASRDGSRTHSAGSRSAARLSGGVCPAAPPPAAPAAEFPPMQAMTDEAPGNPAAVASRPQRINGPAAEKPTTGEARSTTACSRETRGREAGRRETSSREACSREACGETGRQARGRQPAGEAQARASGALSDARFPGVAALVSRFRSSHTPGGTSSRELRNRKDTSKH